jgi:tetratricopeptide (TPR) repeat protein
MPRPLEAVCLKAMARQPEQRYATSLALAADLEHWPADEPVSAWHEPWTVRARRWLGRHRALVTATAASVLVATLLLVAATALLTAANRRERQERERADRNLLELRRAVRKHYTQLSETELSQEPGTQELRKKLLRDALAYFQAFLEQNPNDPEMRDEVADAHYRVGAILQTLGDLDRALGEFQQAARLWEEDFRKTPADVRMGTDLAACYNRSGDVQSQKTGHLNDAVGSYQQARAVLEPLIAANPGAVSPRRELALNYQGLGRVRLKTGDRDGALREYEQARNLWEQLHLAQREVADVQSNLAATFMDIGQVYSPFAYDKALQAYAEARTLLESLQKAHPRVVNYQSQLATVYGSEDRVLRLKGDPDEALRSFTQARDLWADLVRANPSVPNFRSQVAGYSINLGLVYGARYNEAGAIQSFEQAREAFAALVADYPENTSYQNGLAGCRYNLGESYRRKKDLQKALKAFHEARRLWEKLVKLNPTDQGLRNLFVQTLTAIGNIAYSMGTAARAAEALEAYQAALPHLEPLIRAEPSNRYLRLWLAQNYHHSGVLQSLAAAQHVAARRSLQQACRHYRELVHTNPGAEQPVLELGQGYADMGRVIHTSGSSAEALAWYSRAIHTVETVPPNEVDRNELNSLLVESVLCDAYRGRAEAWTRLGCLAEALPDWVRAVSFAVGRDRVHRMRTHTWMLLQDHTGSSDASEKRSTAPNASPKRR